MTPQTGQSPANADAALADDGLLKFVCQSLPDDVRLTKFA